MKKRTLPPLKPLRYKWYQRADSHARFDLVLIGEPDAFAYIVRYRHETHANIYGNVWCWSVTIPRGTNNTFYGWSHVAAVAKREVEAKIAEVWQ